jgi:hypothetical protein
MEDVTPDPFVQAADGLKTLPDNAHRRLSLMFLRMARDQAAKARAAAVAAKAEG